MTWTHGDSGYRNYGCRCDVCREGNRITIAAKRSRRFARRIQVGDEFISAGGEHGSNSTYINHGCRCAACRRASTKQWHDRHASKDLP